MRSIFDSMMNAIRYSGLHLDNFQVIGFALSSWQSALAPTMRLLNVMTELPRMQVLTHLELEMDMITDNSNCAILSVVKLIENNANLQGLRLSTALPLVTSFKTANEYWSPLLDVLGHAPPFRLHKLDLDGLVTCGSITLDQIIKVHASTLRHITLDHVNFRSPNSIRSFFTAMACTDVDFFATRNFWMYERSSWLSGGSFRYKQHADEVLECSEIFTAGKDAANFGWTDIKWESFSHEQWATWNSRSGKHVNNQIKERMRNVIAMIDCCELDSS